MRRKIKLYTIHNFTWKIRHFFLQLKGIVSRDFEGLQMVLMDRIGVPDVPLEVYSFLNLHLHIAFQFLSLQRVKLLLMHLAKA